MRTRCSAATGSIPLELGFVDTIGVSEERLRQIEAAEMPLMSDGERITDSGDENALRTVWRDYRDELVYDVRRLRRWLEAEGFTP